MTAHALTDGRRDFALIWAFRADSYGLLVDDTHTEQATQLLNATGTRHS